MRSDLTCPSQQTAPLPNSGLGLERGIENPSWIDVPLIPDSSKKAKPMATFNRRKLLVDPKVQGAFLARILLYWFLCLVASGTAICRLDSSDGRPPRLVPADG